jgi:hypothetical protein
MVAFLDDGMYNAAYLLRFAGRPAAVLKVAPPDDVPRLRYEWHRSLPGGG